MSGLGVIVDARFRAVFLSLIFKFYSLIFIGHLGLQVIIEFSTS